MEDHIAFADSSARDVNAAFTKPEIWSVTKGNGGVSHGTRLTGVPAPWSESEWPPSPLVKALKLEGSAALEHWAFGGTSDQELSVSTMLSHSSNCYYVNVSVQLAAESAACAIVTALPAGHILAPHAQILEDMNLALESAGNCAYAYDESTLRPVFLSHLFNTIQGITNDEYSRDPRSWLRNVLPEDRSSAEEAIRTLTERGVSSSRYRIRGSDGIVRQVQNFVAMHSAGRTSYISGVLLDISSVGALKEEVTALRQAVDFAKEGFSLADKAGTLLYVNQEQVRMFGYSSAAEMLGQSWQILHDSHQAALLMREAAPVLLRTGVWHGIAEARRKDGSRFTDDLTLSVLPNGAVVCNCRDRTFEVRMQEDLRRSEMLFRAFAHALPMGVLIRDAQGTVEFVNDLACLFLGIERERFQSSSWKSSIPPDLLRNLTDREQEGTETNVIAEDEFEVSRVGKVRALRVAQFTLRNTTGAVERQCAVLVDITRLKQLERDAQDMAERRGQYLSMQREFISMVSHEFRTPIASMQGAHYLMGEQLRSIAIPDPSTAKFRRYLDLQGHSIGTLKGLVDQVLLLNRIEHMTAKATLTKIAVGPLIRAIVDQMAASMSEMRILLELSDQGDCALELDAALFRAAVENLISNALKYSPPASPVRITARTGGGSLIIEVIDTGRGIPEEEHGQVFKSFFRASNVGATPGTGLGLAIVQRAMAFHGGDVEFQSASGCGTTFRLFFPLQQSAQMTPRSIALFEPHRTIPRQT